MFDRTLRLVERGAEAARLLPIAQRLNESPRRIFDSRWRRAVRVSNWELIPPIVKSDLRLVCDVGANHGDWSDAMLRLAPEAQIIAFEPNPELYALLRRRFEHERRIQCRPEAIGASASTATFNVEAQSELSSLRLLSPRARRFHNVSDAPLTQCEVDVLPLDTVLPAEEDISLLKIDVQGFEREVIAGARRSLQRCRCAVVELLYDPDYYQGAEGFLGLAAMLERETPLRLSCVSAPALAPDGFGAWADAVFVHRSLRSSP